MLKTRIAVLVSGGGTNLQALIDAEKDGILHSGEIVVVVSGNEKAYALERARKAGIPAEIVNKKQYESQRDYEQALEQKLAEYGVQMVVLAGFMNILSGEFTKKYPDRIINAERASMA